VARCRTREIVRHPLHFDDCGIVHSVDFGAHETKRRHALDQIRALTPVIERRERADHRHDGVGYVAVVVRAGVESFDFTNHVVADVADHAALKRRQFIDDRRLVRLQHRLECREKASVARHRRRHRT